MEVKREEEEKRAGQRRPAKKNRVEKRVASIEKGSFEGSSPCIPAHLSPSTL